MSLWRGVLRFPALAALLAAAPPPMAAQFRQWVAWPLVDILVRGDSAGQMEILASPNLSSVQGRSSGTRITRIVPRAVDALQWAAVMGRRLDSVDAQPRRAAISVLEPGLAGRVLADAIFLGVVERGGSERFRFIVTDTDSSRNWQVAASIVEVRAFLRAVSEIAGAVLVPDRREGHLLHDSRKPWCEIYTDSTVTDANEPQTRPDVTARGLVYPAMEQQRGQEGRVWLQFVIDSTARVAPDSPCVLFADTEGFAAAVLRALPKFRLRSATWRGKPVSALVFQEYRFALRRP